jgi:uncharacterized protein YhaN
LPAQTWQKHDRTWRQARERIESVLAVLAQHRQKKAKLQRIRDALPLIAHRKEIEIRLAAHQNVPQLSADFSQKRQEAEKELNISTRDQKRIRANIGQCESQIQTLEIPHKLLTLAASIEALQQKLGSIRKAQQDRPNLEGRMRALYSQAQDKLAQIDVNENTDRWQRQGQLPLAIVSEIQSLSKTYEHLTAKLDAARKQYRKQQTRYERLSKDREAMASPVDTWKIEAAVQSALAAGAIEKRLSSLTSANAANERRLQHALKRQVLWKGPFTQLSQLTLPSKENIDRFELQLDQARRRLEKLRENQTNIERELRQIENQLADIESTHEVPTEADLQSARQKRDQRWRLIRRQLTHYEGATDTGASATVEPGGEAGDLVSTFEGSLAQADLIADRLRWEAEAVSQKGLLATRRANHQAHLARLAKKRERAARDLYQVENEWRVLWLPSGIDPLSPQEMRAWLVEMIALRDRLTTHKANMDEAQEMASTIQALKVDLQKTLEQAGVSPPSSDLALVGLIKKAQSYLGNQKALTARITETDSILARLDEEQDESIALIREIEDGLTQWQDQWQANIGSLGLDQNTSPHAAMVLIENMREAREKVNEAQVLQKRIAGIDRDIATFRERVDQLGNELAADLKGQPHVQIAELLNARLIDARQRANKRQGLKEQLLALQKDEEDAKRRYVQHSTLLQALCREAQCDSSEALAGIEKRAQIRQTLLQERQRIEERLRHLSGGSTIDDFMAEAQTVAADTIDFDLQQLDAAIKELEKQRSQIDQTIGSAKARLDEMDGRAKAAEYAEEAQALLGVLESDVERYTYLKMAVEILTGAIELYREKHQGPLIARASEFFTRMTLGGFDRLLADYDDKGEPILVGLRSGSGDKVTVEGMSDGTADQLYLALRLASLEEYLQSSEPLPFIVDDILLRFDDDRALATLGVLAEMAKQTQVLFFTHHQHLVQLAQSAPSAFPFHYHTMAS